MRRPAKKIRVGDSAAVKYGLIGFVLFFAALLIVAPLVVIATEALSKGWGAYIEAIVHPDTRSAIMMTVVTALIAVPVNTGFGIAAAWAITKFDFPGRGLLLVIVEIPFSVSPIVAGVCYLCRACSGRRCRVRM
jgi:sulfate transport system permease protein